MIVTFLYRITGSSNRYYGKYIGYLSENYTEGLDHELRMIIEPSLLTYYHLSHSDDIKIGILSCQRNSNDYFSEDEKQVFDLLYCNWSNQPVEIFFDQVLFEMPK